MRDLPRPAVLWELGVREVLAGVHDGPGAPRRARARHWVEATTAAFGCSTSRGSD